ncbi:hypothetical protein [Brachyspira hyodysenteriae]|uniref:hypothetical protein n=1 Tax=Brachyspira hyodysenteriae TaxID=159 RepID=UPI0022CD2289|nr:hypothetical protein [Brachyspira hyodysenteriae]MCZ9948287.1 hypothetical protein [Brachyspira hyodysenteriae]
MLSCLTVPEIYLNNNVIYWREYVANKSASPIFIKTFIDLIKNADMDYIAYGYKSKIKYKLFLMKESNEAFYYKNVTLKTYIIESLPSFNLYEDALNKKDYSTLYMNNYFNRTTFSDTSIYLPIGLAFKYGNLYIAKTYGEDYKDRLSHWLRISGYGTGKEWKCFGKNVDWNSYSCTYRT